MFLIEVLAYPCRLRTVNAACRILSLLSVAKALASPSLVERSTKFDWSFNQTRVARVKSLLPAWRGGAAAKWRRRGPGPVPLGEAVAIDASSPLGGEVPPRSGGGGARGRSRLARLSRLMPPPRLAGRCRRAVAAE